MFTYFAIAVWDGFASPFSPGRHKSELSASPSSSSSDGWQRSQSNIHQHPWEGGSRHHRRETEGRGGGVISCDWGSSVKGRGTRRRGSFSLMRFRDLLENSINLSRFHHGLPLFACGAGSSPLWRARSFSHLIDRPSDLKESEDGDGPGRTDWLHTNHR